MKFKVGDYVRPKLIDPNRFEVRKLQTVRIIESIPYDTETDSLRLNRDPGFGYYPDNTIMYNSDYFVLAKLNHTKLGKVLYKQS